MNEMILKKQKHNEPEFDELGQMLSGMEEFLNTEANPNDKQWVENLRTIIDFQDDDGSFKLFNSYKIPSDAKVDFCYMPTYLCTAALMKAYLTTPETFTIKEKSALSKGLEMSATKNLWGHGFEGFKGQIEALNIFMKAGLNEFMDLHHDFCPEFSEMISNIITKFQELESEGKFTGPWGESYEEDIKSVNEYFCQRLVFVYGTLMEGESNHHYLKNAKCLGPASIKGYDMFDVGWYPAIAPGEGLIIGELYQVPNEDMASLDMLEGEGTLYLKKCERTTLAEGETLFALTYIFMEDTMNLERISSWKKDYLWYVSYGSNMLKERFMTYIEGGSFENSRPIPPCSDTTPPLAVKPIEIPHDMYFGNESGSWHGSGVSFLDTTGNGRALGVAYLITKEQFDHVCRWENAGRDLLPGYVWYEDIIDLEEIEGFETKTLTNNEIRPYNEPYQRYLNILFRGIKQNWPEMSDEEIWDYLNDCIRNY